MSQSSHSKRLADSPTTRSPTLKRKRSTPILNTKKNRLSRTSLGIPVEGDQDITSPSDDGVFLDALEQQDGLVGKVTEDASSTTEKHEDEKMSQVAPQVDEEMGDAAPQNDDPGAEDIFEATFGKSAKHPAKEDDEQAPVIKDEHENECNGTRGASTPPRSSPMPDPGTHKSTAVNGNQVAPAAGSFRRAVQAEIHPEKDQSTALKNHRKFHDRVKPLKPSLKLADHRYWIAVLPPDREMRNAKDEKHFTWMKGNRLTTVETVWHTFQTTALVSHSLLPPPTPSFPIL